MGTLESSTHGGVAPRRRDVRRAVNQRHRFRSPHRRQTVAKTSPDGRASGICVTASVADDGCGDTESGRDRWAADDADPPGRGGRPPRRRPVRQWVGHRDRTARDRRGCRRGRRRARRRIAPGPPRPSPPPAGDGRGPRVDPARPAHRHVCRGVRRRRPRRPGIRVAAWRRLPRVDRRTARPLAPRRPGAAPAGPCAAPHRPALGAQQRRARGDRDRRAARRPRRAGRVGRRHRPPVPSRRRGADRVRVAAGHRTGRRRARRLRDHRRQRPDPEHRPRGAGADRRVGGAARLPARRRGHGRPGAGGHGPRSPPRPGQGDPRRGPPPAAGRRRGLVPPGSRRRPGDRGALRHPGRARPRARARGMSWGAGPGTGSSTAP